MTTLGAADVATRLSDPLFPGEPPLHRARAKVKPRAPKTRSVARKPARRGGGLSALLMKWLFVAMIWGAVLGGMGLLYFAYDLPDITRVARTERRPSVTLLTAQGAEFARIGDLHSGTVRLEDLPSYLPEAVVAIEDRRFRYHFGIDPIGLARALYVNEKTGRRAQGASTLTQQLAKNLFLTPEKSIRRKVQEALLAVWLEWHFTKDQILAAYLNRVYLGAGAYGVDAAARTYFDKPASEVSLWEAATLAALLKAPSRYSPTANPDEAAVRARLVLAAMADQGYINERERAAALAEPARTVDRSRAVGRYFADWVADQVEGYIGRDHGDVVVRTTFDPNLQRAAERRVAEILDGPGATTKVGQAALLAMSPDGAVRAMVGGRDYGASEFNRATQALRQPGSSFKPFIYLAALESGISPDSTIEDTPVRIGDYSPGNYDGKFRGTITVAQALAYSSNVATLRLLDRVGVDKARRVATALGISTPLTRDLSLALGTSEVSLLDLTRAYAGIANHGVAVWPYAITEIRDREGRQLYRRNSGGGVVVADAERVAALTAMMEGVVTYGTGKVARLDRPVAAKSGTTQNYHDAWFLGFTSDLVTGVWLGNDDNAPMKKVTGGGLPAKLWHDFMADAYLPAGAARSVRPDAGIGGLIEDLDG